MRLYAWQRCAALLFCLLLLALSFFTVWLASTHILHNCLEDQCTICATIHSVQNLLRRITLLLQASFLSLLVLLGALIPVFDPVRRRMQPTLISLKVRMNP